MLKTASGGGGGSGGSGSVVFPLSPANGGTGIVAQDPGQVFYSGPAGEHFSDPNFRYDDSKRQINLTGGLNSQLNQRLAADFTVTSSTTLADVSQGGSSLSVDVASAGVYLLNAVLFTTSDVAAGIKAALGGTCTITSLIAEALVTESGVLKVPSTTRITALATTVGQITAVTVARISITGYLVVNLAGTLTVQFAQNVSGVTGSKVLAGSSLTLTPVS